LENRGVISKSEKKVRKFPLRFFAKKVFALFVFALAGADEVGLGRREELVLVLVFGLWSLVFGLLRF
jgi:hypothetical protein